MGNQAKPVADPSAHERSGTQGRPMHTLQHYDERLGRALAYIDQHLAQPILLDELAACASFSPFHFHRVFCQWHGETPQAYIRRYRLQRAAALLQYAPERSIAGIAEQSGFTSAQAFVRAFRGYFDMTPSNWRSAGLRAQGQVRVPMAAAAPYDSVDLANLSGADGLAFDQVQVRQFPRRRIAYQRNIGPYGENETALWQRLSALLAAHGVAGGVCFGIGLDDPAITPAGRCRFDACVDIPSDLILPVQIPVKTLEGGLHAILPYRGAAGQTLGHWQMLIQRWLPQSPYSINEQPCFERFPQGICLDHKGQRSMTGSELCLPLRRRPRQARKSQAA